MRAATARRKRIMLFCVLLPFWISILVRSFACLTLLRGELPVNDLLLATGVFDEPPTLVRNETGVLIDGPLQPSPETYKARHYSRRLLCRSFGVSYSNVLATARACSEKIWQVRRMSVA